MIDGKCGLESGRIVAVFTDIRCLDVHQAFSSCRCAIVAADAISNDAGMIKQGGEPTGRVVAVVALVIRRDMGRRFSCRLNTVVTGDAAARQRRVVDECNDLPVRSDMAVRAFAGG